MCGQIIVKCEDYITFDLLKCEGSARSVKVSVLFSMYVNSLN